MLRDVAQLGSAHGSGPWGRGFKSHHPDHKENMDNIIILACNRKDLETFKKCSNFLLPHPKFSCSIVHSFTKDILDDTIKTYKDKSLSLLIDKIIYENELDEVEAEIKEYKDKGIKYFFYSDLAVYTILKKLNLEESGVYYNPTKITSLIEAEAYFKTLQSPLYITTKVEIEDLITISKDIPICYLLYGYRYLFYSKRKLITDFKDEYSLDIKPDYTLYNLKEATREELLPAYEDDNGTFIYTSKPIDNLGKLDKMTSFKFAIVNLNLIKDTSEIQRRLDNE